MQVEEVRVDVIKVGERFRRDLGTEEEMESLVTSIKEKGLLQPITTDTEFLLLAGGRRLEACKLAGIETIHVIRREVAGELDAREIELIENIFRKDLRWTERVRLESRIHALKTEQDPSWTIEKQAELHGGKKKSQVHRDLQLAEALDVIPELAECDTPQQARRRLDQILLDVKVEAAKKDSKYAEASQYAEDHYHIGDALAGMREVQPDICGFAEVDPPYAIDITQMKKGQDRSLLRNYTEMNAETYIEDISKIAGEVYRILMNNTTCVWWFGQEWQKPVYDMLIEVGFKVNKIPAIWFKRKSGGQSLSPDILLANRYEAFFVCRKGNPLIRKPGRSNVFEFQPVAPQHKIHPTEKPIELLEEIIDTFVWPIPFSLLVPFLGSGVTIRAAYSRKLVGFGWDNDKELRNRFIAKVLDDRREGRYAATPNRDNGD